MNMNVDSKGLACLLLVCLIAVPGASADNNTTDPAHYLAQADRLAGPKDISGYNPPHPAEPIRAMNGTNALRYPDVTGYGSDCRRQGTCSFPFIRCESPLTLMIMHNVNATHPERPGPVVAYSLTGWPLKNPVYIIPAGTANVFLPFSSFAEWFE